MNLVWRLFSVPFPVPHFQTTFFCPVDNKQENLYVYVVRVCFSTAFDIKSFLFKGHTFGVYWTQLIFLSLFLSLCFSSYLSIYPSTVSVPQSGLWAYSRQNMCFHWSYLYIHTKKGSLLGCWSFVIQVQNKIVKLFFIFLKHLCSQSNYCVQYFVLNDGLWWCLMMTDEKSRSFQALSCACMRLLGVCMCVLVFVSVCKWEKKMFLGYVYTCFKS